jgi:hypothetical protein
MSAFTIVEPVPHVASNGYTHVGRGGAGNAFRLSGEKPTEALSRPVNPAPRVFYSGRGGAGNVFRSAPLGRDGALQTFNEEVRRAQSHDNAPISHVGRGGAGNVYNAANLTPSEPRHSHETSSTRSGIWSRLSGTFTR